MARHVFTTSSIDNSGRGPIPPVSALSSKSSMEITPTSVPLAPITGRRRTHLPSSFALQREHRRPGSKQTAGSPSPDPLAFARITSIECELRKTSVPTLLFSSLVFHCLRSNFVRARAADHLLGGCGTENTNVISEDGKRIAAQLGNAVWGSFGP